MEVSAKLQALPEKARAKARHYVHQIPEKLVDAVANGVASGSASLVADRTFKAMASKGPVPAVVVAVGGAAVTRGAIQAGYKVAKNAYQDKPLAEDVGRQVLDGMRRGAINGSIALAAAPILKGVSTRYPHLTAVQAGALAGSIKGGISSFVGNATNPKSWAGGVGRGAARVAGATALGMTGGALSGGWGKSASGDLIKRLEPYIDFTGINWGTLIDLFRPGN